MPENSHTGGFNIHFLDYWRVIRNRFPIILTVFMLAVITAYVITSYFITPLYQTSGKMKVVKSSLDEEYFEQDEQLFLGPSWNAEIEEIQSEVMLKPVVQKLKLDERWAREQGSDTAFPLDVASGRLGGMVTVRPMPKSNILEVTVVSDKPELTAEVVNAVMENYVEMRDAETQMKEARAAQTISKEIEMQEAKYEEAKKKLEAMRHEKKLELVNQSVQMKEIEWDRLSGKLEDFKQGLLASQIMLERMLPLSDEEFIHVSSSDSSRSSNNLTSIRSKQLGLESEIKQLVNSGVATEHPRVVALVAEYDKINEQMRNLIQGQKESMRIQHEIAKKNVERLEKEVAQLSEEVRQAITRDIKPYQEAEAEVAREQNLLTMLTMSKKQKAFSQAIVDEPVQIIETAKVPGAPFYPQTRINLIVAGALGLALGISLAFFIEYLDTSVKTMDDVEKFLELPVLAVIPDGVAPLIEEGPDSPNAEGYRILRAKIDLSPRSGTGNTLSMLSGGPGEGKSTTVFNLAYVSAQAGQSVLLVDADMRRPTMHKLLSADNSHGLADVFLGRGEAYQFIRASSVPNLHFISAGDMPTVEMGSFSGLKLREILSDLKLRYDLVLVDAPPVLGISEGSVIAHEVDACILVIQHRRYPRDISLRAKRAIEEVKGNLIGVVLNAVAIQSDEAYYYYSSYGNYYYKDGSKPTPSRTEAQVKAVRARMAASHQENQSAGDSESF
ncbi:MAG: polysaccharide biosynthesis tyrosine autokinase [Verrucomicrobiota bacterium]